LSHAGSVSVYPPLFCCALVLGVSFLFLLFFFNDTATPEIYTLSLHDALPIYRRGGRGHRPLRPAAGGRAARGHGGRCRGIPALGHAQVQLPGHRTTRLGQRAPALPRPTHRPGVAAALHRRLPRARRFPRAVRGADLPGRAGALPPAVAFGGGALHAPRRPGHQSVAGHSRPAGPGAGPRPAPVGRPRRPNARFTARRWTVNRGCDNVRAVVSAGLRFAAQAWPTGPAGLLRSALARTGVLFITCLSLPAG